MKLSLLVSIALAGAPVAAGAQSTYACRTPAAGSEWVRSVLQELVTHSDSASVAARAALHLPAGDSSIVQVVADSATCARAGSAVASVFASVQAPDSGWVYAVGPDRYYVVYPNAYKGKRVWAVILDATFAVLASDPIT